MITSINEFKKDIQFVFPDITDAELDELDNLIESDSIINDEIKDDVIYGIEELQIDGIDVYSLSYKEFYTKIQDKFKLTHPNREDVYLKFFKELTTDPNQLKLQFNENMITTINEFKQINENKEFLRGVAKQIKEKYKNFKLSIRVSYNMIDITILAAPIELRLNSENTHEQVNPYYIREHYKNMPEAKEILQDIKDIASSEVKELVYDGDYGSVPNYYVRLNVGAWDKPFQLINSIKESYLNNNIIEIKSKKTGSKLFEVEFFPSVAMWFVFNNTMYKSDAKLYENLPNEQTEMSIKETIGILNNLDKKLYKIEGDYTKYDNNN